MIRVADHKKPTVYNFHAGLEWQIVKANAECFSTDFFLAFIENCKSVCSRYITPL